jgi:ribonucleoside-diphosphate reductase alpha chain
MQGPTLPISQELHAEKYRGPGESFREAMGRVANALADNPEHYQRFRDVLLGMRFLPAGRVQSAMGSTRSVTPYNCFVSGTIEDSFVEGHGSIMARAAEAAATMRQGGGIGYDFSALRPRGATIRKLQSHSSGPIAFMDIFDAVCRCVASSGHRRGAQMGCLRVDHPDIEEFIRAKQPSDDLRSVWEAVQAISDPAERHSAVAALQSTLRLTGFNTSVLVTNEFMNALKTGAGFDLKWQGQVYKTIDPQALWDMIMRSTWDWAEPGVLFVDTMNNMNNLYYCETLSATNPCVPAGTPILTDQGWQAIDELVDQQVAVWNGEEWSTVTPVITGEDQPLVKVSLSNGESLVCTTAHKFTLVSGVSVEASELGIGDELLQGEWPVVAGGEDHDEAYTQGFFAGDGWEAHKSRNKTGPTISFKRDDKRRCIPRLFTRKVSELKSGYVFLYLKDEYSWSKTFVPDCTWSIRSRLDWLAGLLDSDGTVIWSHDVNKQRSSCSLAISSVNKVFLDRVALMIRTLGVSSNRNVDLRQKSWTRSPACYRLTIKSSLVKRLQLLGLNTTRLELSENRPRSTNQVRLSVTSVECAGQADVVYCFTEPKRHMGCFNGILTRQCGEQPLPPYGACLLGSFNLVQYMAKTAAGWVLDLHQLLADIGPVVRAMDNVVDRARYPLYEQEKEGKAKRRMGLGVTGLANALEALGMPYGSPEFVGWERNILKRITNECYLVSSDLAAEKGSFPAYQRDLYLQSQFIRGLEPETRDRIRRNGIRNSHLTSIAPTGTISLCADNVSSGIEPVFSYSYDRAMRTAAGDRVETVTDYGVRVFGVQGKRSQDVSVDEHLAVLLAASENCDSAVSKTCNVPSSVSWSEFSQVYMRAWEGGAKGCTTFRIDGKRAGILTSKDAEEVTTCTINPDGTKSCE